jgi:hypothetical protein
LAGVFAAIAQRALEPQPKTTADNADGADKQLQPPASSATSAVTTISGMDQPSSVRRSMWRFSLRELLLLMLAIAAFLGWGASLYQHFRRFEATPFYLNNETWQQDVGAVFQELGESGLNEAQGFSIRRNGASSESRTMVFRVPLSDAKRGEFLDAFEKRVEGKLTAAGCNITGGSQGSGKGMRGFVYERGPVDGTFEIWMRDVGDGKVDLTVEMHEQRGRFSIGWEAIAR